jgi:hypothetical protein
MWNDPTSLLDTVRAEREYETRALKKLSLVMNNSSRQNHLEEWPYLLSRYIGLPDQDPYRSGFELLNKYPPAPKDWPHWDPVLETRLAYISRIKNLAVWALMNSPILTLSSHSARRRFIDSIKEIADQYCSEIESYHRGIGSSRVEFDVNLERNLTWAAKFQVLGMSFTEIACGDERREAKGTSVASGKMGREIVDMTTVLRAVNKTLAYIGLERRPNSGRGRRRGVHDSPAAQIIRSLGKDVRTITG